MKSKLTLATLLAFSSLMMVFAAGKVETCDDKYKNCGEVCTNAQASCKARGAVPEECEKKYKMCMQACDKAKKDCESKAKK